MASFTKEGIWCVCLSSFADRRDSSAVALGQSPALGPRLSPGFDRESGNKVTSCRFPRRAYCRSGQGVPFDSKLVEFIDGASFAVCRRVAQRSRRLVPGAGLLPSFLRISASSRMLVGRVRKITQDQALARAQTGVFDIGIHQAPKIGIGVENVDGSSGVRYRWRAASITSAIRLSGWPRRNIPRRRSGRFALQPTTLGSINTNTLAITINYDHGPELSSVQTAERMEIVDALRGLAALAVAWFHFTQGGGLLLPGSLKSSGSYGWLGVEVFFVISGFIIPFSMSSAQYLLGRDGPRFLIRRLIRLEPPYLCSVILCIVLAYLSTLAPGFRGEAQHYSLEQILLHVGYLAGIFGQGWINVVYWSLAIEFQYYVAIAFIFPLLAHSNHVIRRATFGLICAVPFGFQGGNLCLHYLGLFGAGIAVWAFRVLHFKKWEFAVYLTGSGICTWLTMGFAEALAAVGAALLIAFVKIPRIAFLSWLGALSYSLYLLHVPIGGRVINLATRFEPSLQRNVLGLALAISVSLAAAWAWYRCLERPSHYMARRMTYGRSDKNRSTECSKNG